MLSGLDLPFGMSRDEGTRISRQPVSESYRTMFLPPVSASVSSRVVYPEPSFSQRVEADLSVENSLELNIRSTVRSEESACSSAEASPPEASNTAITARHRSGDSLAALFQPKRIICLLSVFVSSSRSDLVCGAPGVSTGAAGNHFYRDFPIRCDGDEIGLLDCEEVFPCQNHNGCRPLVQLIRDDIAQGQNWAPPAGSRA